MASDEKHELDEFRVRFQEVSGKRVAKCLELVGKLESNPSSRKAVAAIEDELTAMEGEAQLLDFEDLSGLF